MAILGEVFTLCRSLVGKGWDQLLNDGYGLNIDQPNKASLETELAKPLTRRKLFAGFEDFVSTDVAGIKPGAPAHSLLYHALASPNVLNGVDGSQLGVFPTLAEIETVENYVFAVKQATLDELLADAGPLAVVVFAYEYRPASQTCHGIHADMVFSRTGVARVGTAPANYRTDMRGFYPELPSDPFAICVSPARFAAYLAVKKKGSAADSRPMRFRATKNVDDPPDWMPDNQRDFWVPVHKLFPGSECLKDAEIKSIDFVAQLLN